jgi:hypothetical protein
MITLIQKAFAADTETKSPTLADIFKFGGTDANFQTIMDGINSIIAIALDLAGVVGFIMILYASVLYVMSFGDESKAETAKKTLLWSIVGTVVIALARVIVVFLDALLK